MTTSYTLDGVADRITCPTLVMDADNDQFLKGQPEQVHQKLSAPTTLITLARPRAPASTATWARCPAAPMHLRLARRNTAAHLSPPQSWCQGSSGL